MTREVQLTRGHVALVDDEDFGGVSQSRWHAQIQRRASGSARVYAYKSVRTPDGKWKTVALHRMLLNAPEGFDVDHIDGNGLNNRKSNLRLCSKAENQHNAQPRTGGASAFKGVTFHGPRKKWAARIRVSGNRIHLGLFGSEEDAARAYDEAARKHFRDFARPNFA